MGGKERRVAAQHSGEYKGLMLVKKKKNPYS
jgi:hypothetical protein